MKRRADTRKGSRNALVLGIGMALAGLGSQALAQVSAPGMQFPGSISYDAEGVPTITAETDEDAAWLMGWAHARDRFFQMDYLRRLASGTLAEILGAPALSSDVQLRTLGLRRAAWASWTKSSDELRGQMKSYADGVNAWLASNPAPIEYGALQLTSADPWTPVDSMVIGKLLAFQLSFDDESGYTLRLGAYQQAGLAGGFNGAALFFEDTHRVAPPDDRISIPDWFAGTAASKRTAGQKQAAVDASSSYKSMPQVSPELLALTQQHVDAIRNVPIWSTQLERRENRAGSNWWVVSGDLTDSGAPILANDPHLGLDTPMLFHEGHVISNDPRYAEPMVTVGSVAPGTPWPILGCTQNFCWGLTTNSLDVTDSFQEQFLLNSYGLPTHTVHDDVAEPVLWVFQTFYANNTSDGVADSVARVNSIGYTNGGVTIIVPRRNFGPIVSISGNTGLSIQYAGWGPTMELEAFRRVNRAANLDEFRAALQYFDAGSQNFAFADKLGNIAYFATAEAPIREDLQQNTVSGLPPFLVRNGQGGNEWLPRENTYPGQSLPFEILSPAEMPFTINPAQGYIANANNDPVGNTLDNNALNQVRPGGGLYYLAPGYSAYRMGRIDRLIEAKIAAEQPITRADMARWQGNNSQLDAELVLPYVLDAYSNASGSSWEPLSSVAATVADAIDALQAWSEPCGSHDPYSTVTGIAGGWDPGDTPFSPAPPSDCEIDMSVGATVWALTRSYLVRNTVNASLSRVGLSSYLPGSSDAYHALKHHLDTFATQQGIGASGIDFFMVEGAPSREAARDFVLLSALKEGLDRLASDEFAPAFANSTDVRDYRWGKLHRKVFAHPLGAGTPFSIPGPNPFPFTDVGPGLRGLARAGGYEVVDASGHSSTANTLNGFMFGSGPVRRFVGEMTDPPTLLQIAPGGQSGDINSGAAYISQLPRWLVNAYKPLVIDPAASAAGAIATIPFTPQ